MADIFTAMKNCKVLCGCLVVALLAGWTGLASAQTFESIGVRAQGMSAFVAVADDATASWWNPAGLATGQYLSTVTERGRMTEPANPTTDAPAARTASSTFAIAFPAMGLSYYRLRISATAPLASIGTDGPTRQDQQIAGTSVHSVAIAQFGATVGQSIGDHLVIGSTLKLLRAGAVSGESTDASPLDVADALKVPQHTRADLDVGAMARAGHVRVGVTVKNLTEPTFETGGSDTATLSRQVRAGIAILSVRNGVRKGLIIAADADLTTTSTAVGDVKHVSAGFERWLAGGRFGFRAGASANTVGERRPAGSAGLSVALTRALSVNASRTVGRDESVTGWSAGVNVAY